MLGNFHIELAFYGAIGTMINESGIEFILTEAKVLAEGSMMGFMKGKFYNHCIRIHELLANVMEQKLYDRFVQDLAEEEYQAFQDVMMMIPSNQIEDHLSDPVVMQHLLKYEECFYSVMEGTISPMAQFWGTYVFLVNRVHRELQRCVKTNDVDGYIDVFPVILDVFFSLNRPNYSRWGTLFLHKLTSSHPQLREILQKGAFSIRRTKKNYSRSAVDFSLEQTVNRDAASSMKGIVAFRNSENARRRWSMTMTQRAMAVLELRTFAGLEVGESATAQCRSYRIRKDNKQMQALSEKIDEFCNPFSPEAPDTMVNLATGRAATKETEKYLFGTLQRGQVARQQFKREWHKDSARFLKSVKRIRVNNFASENEKKKKKETTPATETAKRVESLRHFFIRIIIVVAENTNFDLRHVLRYPITSYPLSLAHADGALLKSRKHTLLNRLEEFQKDTPIPTEVHQGICVRIYDGGLLIHSVLSVMNVGTSYGAIARTIISTVCTGGGDEIHVCLDKYVENSVNDSERKLRGAEDSVYTITGPNQTMRRKGAKLLKNGMFKNELGKFLLKEWGGNHYWNILNGKTLYASYGGECFQYTPNDFQEISVTSPAHLQANHEEADTLIAFHLENTSGSKVLVRASDTDVLIILIGILGNQDPEVRSSKNVFMDCGSGNSRRYINVTNIVEVLEEQKSGLPKALAGYHAFTGCDFTSAFYRKGKVKPLEILEKDPTGSFLQLFSNMGEVDGEVDIDVASEFVCKMYGQNKERDVDEARYRKIMQMSGTVDKENPLLHIKKVDCALLPPTRRTLEKKLLRAHYVTVLWSHANTKSPDQGLCAIDYGWAVDGDLLQPTWFDGPAVPDSLFANDSDKDQEILSQSEETVMETDNLDELSDYDQCEDEPWSEDSDSDTEEMD
ncbi:uncharacterized protein [Palaemon carinicauda]|uniref:uncharacterized protein n=1 Tax=Palaemon carinicauda TaxID=392227 RepID=UPI0035B691F1